MTRQAGPIGNRRGDVAPDELDALVREATDWLRIPSVSAGARDERGLLEAAQWVRTRVLAAGGECELVDTPGGAPLVVGELRHAWSAAQQEPVQDLEWARRASRRRPTREPLRRVGARRRR